MDNCLYIFAKDVVNMKFELIKHQKSNYHACSPANHIWITSWPWWLSTKCCLCLFVFVFVPVIVFPFVLTADHVEPPLGHDGCQQDLVPVFSLSLSHSHLPIMLNLPLAMTSSSKMLKEMFSSSKLSFRSTTKSFTNAPDNPVKVVFPKCKSTST